jgi:hypothetical protein
MRLGEDLPFITDSQFAGRGSLQSPRTYYVIAGSYLAVNAYAGSVSPQILTDIKAQLEHTKAVLESADQTQISALSREDLLGDLFHAGGLGYYAQLTALSHIMGIQAGAHHTLAAGTGTFGYEPKVNYFFGFPRSIKPGGVAFDIPIVIVTGVNDGNADKKKQFTLQTGILGSALEHAVPEQMFVNEQNPGEAISAVKALQKASAAGQRIYHITQANQSAILGNIHHDTDTMNEIRNALNAGKEVITHTDAVSVPGWSGAGYIITDLDIGDGAFKIAGGGNGGVITTVGFTDFLIAIIENPSSILPPCTGSYIGTLVNNFVVSNEAIPGFTVPIPVTLATGGLVASAIGLFTLVDAIKLSIKNRIFLLGNIMVALVASVANIILVGGAFEFGLLVGSTIGATICRSRND